MNEKEMFNQKLKEIGGGEILEGISIRGQETNKILDFINANSGYQYKIDENGLLKRVSNDLKRNNNLDGIFQTFLDIELESAMNEKRKIIISFSNKNMEEDLIVLKSENERIVLLNNLIYSVTERFIETEDIRNEGQKIQKDLLYNEGLTDRLIKSLYEQEKIITTRSSRATVGTMAQNQNVQFGPSEKNYASAGSVNAGEQVYILSKAFGYYHIQYHVGSTGQEKQGYVPQVTVANYTGPNPEEENYYGGYCYPSTELDVRTCDDFDKTATVGTLYKHEGCTMIFHYDFSENGKSYHVAYVEYSTSSGTKRGYVYNQYLIFPFDTCVGVVNTNINVYGGPSESAYDSIGSLGSLEFVSILAKEGDNIYVEYNTASGRKRGYIKYSQVTAYNRPATFPDFYKNGVAAHIIPQRCIVRGGPNSNYAELGAVNNEDVICFNTNRPGDEYGFEYTCIEYSVTSTGKKKRGYVLATEVIGGNLPEENNPLESFDYNMVDFGNKINYGTTQKGKNMFYYKAGTGSNHLFLIFAQHGWEDGLNPDGSLAHGDGNILVRIAKNFMQRFNNNKDLISKANILKNWTIYVFPGINLDGIVNGNTNNGFGRCFKNGIDPNRSWPGKFKIYTDPRNCTGNTYLGAQELQNLYNVLTSNIGNGENVLLDIHGWENSFISKSTALSNYFMSEMKAINSNFRYKDNTNSTTDTGYLITWANNPTTMISTSQNKAGLGATAGLLEFPPTRDYSDSNILNNYGLHFYNGIYNLLKSKDSISDGNNTDAFNKVLVIHGLAAKYLIETKQENTTYNRNRLTLQYLRYQSYDNLLWAVTAEGLDMAWIRYANGESGLNSKDIKFYIPDKKIYISVEHLAITAETMLVRNNIADSTNRDLVHLSGALGDLIQFGGKIQEVYNSNHREFSLEEIINLIGCEDDNYANNLGFKNAIGTRFPLEDYIQDLDGVNIGKRAISEELPNILRDYYTYEGCRSRESQYYTNSGYHMSSMSTIYENLFDTAYKFTNGKVRLEGYFNVDVIPLFKAVFGNYDANKWALPLAQAFANKVAAKVL